MVHIKNSLELQRLTEHQLKEEQIKIFYELLKQFEKISENLEILVKKTT